MAQPLSRFFRVQGDGSAPTKGLLDRNGDCGREQILQFGAGAVVAGAVCVGYPHLGRGFGVQDTGDHSVRLSCHQRPATRVVVAIRVRLGGMHDPRDALHVNRDQYLHTFGSLRALCTRPT